MDQSSCPFMALQTALDRSKEASIQSREKGNKTMFCPFSGRQAIIGNGSQRFSDDDLGHDSEWTRGNYLGAISEDFENRLADDQEERSIHSGPSMHGRRSMASSMHSLHSLRSMDSAASGFRDPNIPGGSRFKAVVFACIIPLQQATIHKNILLYVPFLCWKWQPILCG